MSKIKRMYNLSEREAEVLCLISKGLSNPEIADKLVVVTDTIKRHTSSILNKMNVENRIQAAIKAIEDGFEQI